MNILSNISIPWKACVNFVIPNNALHSTMYAQTVYKPIREHRNFLWRQGVRLPSDSDINGTGNREHFLYGLGTLTN